MPGWSIPGYAVEELVGAGTTGEVWRARETATGSVVAVKVLRAAAGPEGDRVRVELDRLGSVRHPHLVRPRAVFPFADGIAVVSDFAAGGNLASVLSERGLLAPGEIVTIGVPLASALAALHDQGLVHGAVTATNVLFTDDGRPLLSDFGLPRLPGSAPSAGPRDDVHALAVVLAAGLGGAVPRVLRESVGRALAVDPAVRPSAAELASALRSAGPPAPVRMRGPTAPGEEVAPARPAVRPAGRPAVALLAGVPLALIAAVLAGRIWAAADRPGSPPVLQPARAATSSSPQSALGSAGPAAAPRPPGSAAARSPGSPGSRPPVNWLSVLTRLDDRRNAAFANLDVTALADVYAARSAPLAADAASIRALAAAGARVEGLRLEVRSVQIFRRTPAGTTLRIVDWLAAYEIVAADGRVLERRPARGPLRWLVQMVPARDGWRIGTVARA